MRFAKGWKKNLGNVMKAKKGKNKKKAVTNLATVSETKSSS